MARAGAVRGILLKAVLAVRRTLQGKLQGLIVAARTSALCDGVVVVLSGTTRSVVGIRCAVGGPPHAEAGPPLHGSEAGRYSRRGSRGPRGGREERRRSDRGRYRRHFHRPPNSGREDRRA